MRQKLIDGLKTTVETLFRWFPFPVEPGLRPVGNPGREAPVVLTGNFDLTVRRVLEQLKDEDCYLLVANTKGINVWCSAVGGVFTTQTVISAITISKIEALVDHHTIVLPQLSAPGVNADEVKQATGFKVVFGPVYAVDLPEFLTNGFKKKTAMYVVGDSHKNRLEMALNWSWMITLILIPLYLLWNQDLFMPLLALIWFVGFCVFGLFPILPGKVGLVKAMFVGTLILVASLVYSIPIAHLSNSVIIRWCIGVLVVSFAIGVDAEGATVLQRTRWEEVLNRLGLRIGFSKGDIATQVRMDSAKCTACRSCTEVCPKGCLVIAGDTVSWARENECVQCTACVNQCRSEVFSVESV
ncbi:MAG: hypothetical protein GY850_41930 [bacterium]|nr:hypothetical protein [bacterium]